MTLMDDIDSLKLRVKDVDQTKIIFNEKIKQVSQQLSFSLSGAILSGLLLFVMMYTTLSLNPQQKILNTLWVIYHTSMIWLVWYLWKRIFSSTLKLNTKQGTKLVNQVFITFFIFIFVNHFATYLTLLTFLHTVTDTKTQNSIWVILCVAFVLFTFMVFFVWSSWQKTLKLAQTTLSPPTSNRSEVSHPSHTTAKNYNAKTNTNNPASFSNTSFSNATFSNASFSNASISNTSIPNPNSVLQRPFSPTRFNTLPDSIQSNRFAYKNDHSLYLRNYIAYRLLLSSSFVMGCLWATFTMKVITTNIQYPTQVIALMGLYFSLLASATSSIGAFWRVFIALVAPSMLVWLVTIFTIDSPRLQLLSVAVLLLLSLHIFIARHNWLNSVSTIQVYLENTKLVTQLGQKSKQLQHASMAKTQFLAAASHDLRQPAHALSLFLESLVHTKLTPHQSKIVNYAKSASQSSREMLNSILDYTHLDSGEMIPHILPTNLHELIQSLLDEFGMQAINNGLSLRYHPTNLWVMSDPAMLSLILRNFLSNSIRYTDTGGVLIGARLLPASKDGINLDFCRVSVWDTGSGIKPEETAKIFESFQQLARNNKNNQGLGLGLSIAQGMAKLLNLPLGVNTKFGTGSQFSVDVPICAPNSDCQTLDRLDPNNHLAGKKVLVVDDEYSVLKSMRMLLEAWGCQVTIALTLNEAVSNVKTMLPQIVITDFRLSNAITGEHVLQAIKPFCAKPVQFVILTADTSPKLIKTTDLTNLTIWHKPIDPKTLYLNLQKLAANIEQASKLKR